MKTYDVDLDLPVKIEETIGDQIKITTKSGVITLLPQTPQLEVLLEAYCALALAVYRRLREPFLDFHLVLELEHVTPSDDAEYCYRSWPTPEESEERE